MVRAILFDMGGTLDGDGLHWLDRFAGAYASAGVTVSRETLRAAFDTAEQRASSDQEIASADLDTMVERHVGWQLEQLALASWQLRREIVARFVGPIRAAARTNVKVLSALKTRGFELAVVSNGCGNVDVLCGDLGYTPYLSAIVDSRRVRLFKPDPAIYVYAADRVGVPPSWAMMVGDSFDRDIRPAKAVGMQTAWLEGPQHRDCPVPAMVDLRLRSLAELPAALDQRAETVV